MNNGTEWATLIAGVTATAWAIVEFMSRLAGGMYAKLMLVFFS